MESIGEYAALVSQATALNQTEFEEKAQQEQAKVEEQGENFLKKQSKKQYLKKFKM